MALTIALLVITILSSTKAESLAYTFEAYGLFGEECITNCINGKCLAANDEYVSCSDQGKVAATYYTSRYKHPDVTTCLSKCVFGDDRYSWCYIDYDKNWDYCNPSTDDTTGWHQYTLNNGRCKDECSYRGYGYLWCHTMWSNWDYCEQIFYYEEDVKTVYGVKCSGDCFRHDGSYYWCYDESRSKEKCAPSAVYYNLYCPSRHRRSRSPPRRTVAEYNQDIDNDGSLTTVTLSTQNYPDLRSPILDYTYRTTLNGLTLPVRIRARILPDPYQHLRSANSRKSSDISSEAERNCRRMGMNRCSLRNNDQLGHLIPYIIGGPADWFNVVPQTQRINIGTTTNTDLVAPSVWSGTEREMRRWVEAGGTVEYTVVVAYDQTFGTRPAGFGTIERSLLPNGTVGYDCPGYWYSNDPNQDPDVWNE